MSIQLHTNLCTTPVAQYVEFAKQQKEKLFPDASSLSDVKAQVKQASDCLYLWDLVPLEEQDNLLRSIGWSEKHQAIIPRDQVGTSVGREMLKLLSPQPNRWTYDPNGERKGPQFLIRDLGMAPGRPVMICGETHSGKTWLAQYIAACVVTGKPILGTYHIQNEGAVLHLNWDGSANKIDPNYDRLFKGLGATPKYDLEVYQPDWYLEDVDAYRELVAACTGKVLCVVDSFRAGCREVDENDSRCGVYASLLGRVSEATGCTMVLIHHMGKKSEAGKMSARGSSALVGACDTKIDLVVNDLGMIEASFHKKCIWQRSQDFAYCMQDEGTDDPITQVSEAIVFSKADKVKARSAQITFRILNAIAEGANTRSAINLQLEMKSEKLGEHLRSLETDGLIKNDGGKQKHDWSLTDKGEDYLSNSKL